MSPDEEYIVLLRKHHPMVRARKLIEEARDLIIESGESMEVSLQFRQHAWLADMAKFLAEF